VGLTLVRSLVSMHGGTVSAHSDGEGRGAEFVVRLPLAITPALQDEETPSRRRPLPQSARVVVVEDNADSRDLLCEVLIHAGFECRTAETGLTGLQLIEEYEPDIAILDVGLPEIDGFEVARRIRHQERHAQMCLIALTGYGQPQDRAAAREAGFDAHVVKPVDPDVLVRLLTEMRRSDS
jgi:CheY-like chemotaxis protein